MTTPVPHPRNAQQPTPDRWQQIPHLTQLDDMGRGIGARPHATWAQAHRWWLKNMWVFNGRASRSEYWWVMLTVSIVSLAVSAVDSFFGSGSAQAGFSEEMSLSSSQAIIFAVATVINLILTVCTVSLIVRRLHDRNLSGWWLLGVYVICLLPFVVSGVVMVSTKPDGGGLPLGSIVALLVSFLIAMAAAIVYIVWMALPGKAAGLRFDTPGTRLPVPEEANWTPANPDFHAVQAQMAGNVSGSAGTSAQ
jgi:uncharacterized membrane protein YhaH (DUF805 family)